MSITEFLLARIAEDESTASELVNNGHGNSPRDRRERGLGVRMLADVDAKRRIIDWHRAWPTLVNTPIVFEPSLSDESAATSFRASQQIAWLTDQEYRERFGSEPPTGPVLRYLAMPYINHPDFDEAWKI